MRYQLVADALGRDDYDLISTDLFDSVLLRDVSAEQSRLAEACSLAAPLLGVRAAPLITLRWDVQRLAYRTVLMERPSGEVSLREMTETVCEALGLDAAAARVLRDVEVNSDIRHLRANRRLLSCLRAAAAQGTRVIAVSDTFYSGEEIEQILSAVVGDTPISAIYASADLGLTKRSGSIYPEVARREGVSPDRIIHLGDDRHADDAMARAAGWRAIHLPRGLYQRGLVKAGTAAADLVAGVRSVSI